MSKELLSVEEAKTKILKYWGEPSILDPKRIDELISAVRREEHEKRQVGLNQKLRRIIELTASIESDNAVWGNDTECGSIEDLVDSAKKILEEK